MHIHAFCACDLDLDPMTLIYENALDILTIYIHAKNELSRSRLSKVRALQADRQTDRQKDGQMRIRTLARFIRNTSEIILQYHCSLMKCDN